MRMIIKLICLYQHTANFTVFSSSTAQFQFFISDSWVEVNMVINDSSKVTSRKWHQ